MEIIKVELEVPTGEFCQDSDRPINCNFCDFNYTANCNIFRVRLYEKENMNRQKYRYIIKKCPACISATVKEEK